LKRLEKKNEVAVKIFGLIHLPIENLFTPGFSLGIILDQIPDCG
jgi:hypothetical protein